MNANIKNDFVDILYQQSGKSSQTNELGMREMQAKAYEALKTILRFMWNNTQFYAGKLRRVCKKL